MQRTKAKRPRIIEDAVRCDEVAAELRSMHREVRTVMIRAARKLAQVMTSKHYLLEACSSIAHFGERMGYAGREAAVLASAAKALELRPELEERVMLGKLSLDSAAHLRRILENPALVRPGEDWFAWAEEWSARRLAYEIQRRRREVEAQEPVSTITAILTLTGREKFDRAQQLASRSQGRVLTEGETVEIVVDHYLDAKDPQRVEPGTRQMPDTAGEDAPEGRNIPAEVMRKILERHGDRCPVPKCDHRIWMEHAHIHAHAAGGCRELWNLLYLCWQHHRLLDANILKRKGKADDPIFIFPNGDALRATRSPP
jgi:hypothetical protein